MLTTQSEPPLGWHIMWAPSGFGNSTARLIQIKDILRQKDENYDVFFPTYLDRLKDREVLVPLFPNYAFVYCRWYKEIDEKISAITSTNVVFLRSPGADNPYIMTKEEMDRVKATLDDRVEEAKEMWHVGGIVVGDTVLIKTHNIQGTVLYFLPPNRAMVETELIGGYPTPVPVKIIDLERI